MKHPIFFLFIFFASVAVVTGDTKTWKLIPTGYLNIERNEDNYGGFSGIDISDDGSIKISSSNLEAAESAKKKIETLTEDVEVDKIYEGKVVKIMDFGAFVSVLPGKDGLVHISQISNERVENVTDKVNEGDIVKVKVIEIDKQGRIKLSMKAVDN